SGTEASVNLRQGKLVARVARPGDNLAITASDTRTSNDGPAHFIVMATEGGRVSVASTEGTARFTAAGKEVQIVKGKTSHAEPGGAADNPLAAAAAQVAELRADNDRLRELLAAAGRLAEFGRFAAQQIHELRQPLFAIKGLSQLLLEKDRVDLEEVLDFARHIVEQSERLTALVSNLRLLSVPATQDAVRRSEIGAVLVRVTSLLEFRLRKAGATLRTQIAPDVPLLAVAPHALEQILINLLANALDAVGGVAHPVVQV